MKFYSALLALFLLLNSCQPTPDQESGKIKIDSTNQLTPPQCITSLYIPEQVIFAGDTVPLNRPDVKQALEYELMVNTFRQSHTLLIIKNIERWRPLVAQILEEAKVPEDFIYLAVIESEFDNNALSYAGASGMWQIMKNTAKDYDLKMNNDMDMRRDPKLATEAAAKFLTWSYNKLNNWTLTAASYNIGMKGIKDRLEEQKVTNFYDLHLNSETARYVYRIVAMKLILENPEAYGYFVRKEDKYPPYKFTTVTIKKDIPNLVDFAQENKTTYKELRLLNPWFNNTSNFKLKIHGKDSVEIRIPLKD